MDSHLAQKAHEKAFGKTKELSRTPRVPAPENLDSIKEKRIEERKLEEIAPKTGYYDLDRVIKGFIPGHLYTLTGETNVGKSSLACNFAVKVAKQDRRVLYVALEPENTVIDYIASVYHDKEFSQLTVDDLNLNGLNISVLGKEEVDTADKLVKILDVLDRYDLVIVDHIGYFITSQNAWLQQQSNTIKKLVAIAKKKPCAMMIIAHMRKKAKNEKKNAVPTHDDISGSGSFKQDSTEVMIATRDYTVTEEGDVIYTTRGRLYVTKTKVGPNGSIGLSFADRNARIKSDVEYNVGFEKSDDLPF